MSAAAVHPPRAPGPAPRGPLLAVLPALAVALWVPAFSNTFFPTGNALLRLGFAAAIVAILTVHLTSRGAPAPIWRHPAWLALTLATLGWAVATIMWAYHPDPAVTESLRAGLAVFVAVAIVWVVRTEREVVWLALALAAGPVISAAIGIAGGESVEQYAAGETFGRLTGGAGDSNQLAAGLAPAVALSIGLIASRWSRPVGWLALMMIPIALIGLGQTESRGGAIAIALVLVLGLMLMRGARRWLMAALAFAAVAAAVATALSPGALSRVTDFDSDGTGREDLWRIAADMSADHPWGIGLNNFRSESISYALDPGNLEHEDQVLADPIVVHNTFLQFAAETGVVGLFLFLGVVAASLASAWSAAKRFEAAGDPNLAILARAGFVAIVAFLAASFFVSFGFGYRMWSLLALGPALLTAARSRERRGAEPAGAP